mgnify:CR=1 FL=1
MCTQTQYLLNNLSTKFLIASLLNLIYLDLMINTVLIFSMLVLMLKLYLSKEILKELHLIKNVPTFTSCPTCGRTAYNMIPIAHEIEEYLNHVNKDIHVAVMGCAVNGPGEAKEADLGVAGGKGEALLFKKGQIIRKIKEENIIEELKKEIDLL